MTTTEHQLTCAGCGLTFTTYLWEGEGHAEAMEAASEVARWVHDDGADWCAGCHAHLVLERAGGAA